jgi:hypothetical protein
MAILRCCECTTCLELHVCCAHVRSKCLRLCSDEMRSSLGKRTDLPSVLTSSSMHADGQRHRAVADAAQGRRARAPPLPRARESRPRHQGQREAPAAGRQRLPVHALLPCRASRVCALRAVLEQGALPARRRAKCGAAGPPAAEHARGGAPARGAHAPARQQRRGAQPRSVLSVTGAYIVQCDFLLLQRW